MQTKGQLSKSACCFFVCTIFDSFLNDLSVCRHMRTCGGLWHEENNRRTASMPVLDNRHIAITKQIDTINNIVICLEQMAFSFAKRGE